jgi:sulfite reductase alpha subunit-like flavoprotein
LQNSHMRPPSQLTPINSIDSIYQPWLKDLKEYLTTTYPLPPSVQPIAEEEPLPPRYTLSLCLPEAKRKPTQGESGETKSTADFPPPVLLPHPNTNSAVVVSNKRVTPSDHWQDVRLVELDVTFPSVDGVACEPLPGDRVVVYPKNYPSDVQKLIDLMEWGTVADKEIVLGSKTPNGLYPPANCTLRDLLTHNIDFTAVPSRSFLHKLAFYTTHVDQKEKLFELVQPDSSQEFYDFTSRPHRTILEVLAEFYSSKIPYEAVPDVFPIIRGREFSIANGGEHWSKTQTSKAEDMKDEDSKTTTEAPANTSIVYRLDILAALVEYRTIIRKPREGLCSRYLKNLPAGTPLHVDLKRETPPPNGSIAAGRPLIAIATGTGVAPVRSLIHDRSQSSPRAETLLFFGCRNKSADYHFHEEWATTEDLTVIPAFSRDPKEPEPEPESQAKPAPAPEAKPEVTTATEKPVTNGTAVTNGTVTTEPSEPTEPAVIVYSYDEGKNYVQHMIRRNADKVCELLRKDAIICLCGNSGRMPNSVREALKDAAVSGGFCKDTDEAEKLLFDEKDPNRIVYWEETW